MKRKKYYIEHIKEPRIMKYGLRVYNITGEQYFRETLQWCIENFGPTTKQATSKTSNYNWTFRENFWHAGESGQVGYGAVYFQHEENMIAYKLRWDR